MKSKWVLVFVLIAVVLAFPLSACQQAATTTTASPTVEAKKFRFSWASAALAGAASGKAIQWWADEINKRTNGQVTFDLFFGGTLYNENTAMDALIAGGIDWIAVWSSSISSYNRAFDWSNLPYIVDPDPDRAAREYLNIRRSEVGQEMIARFENALGVSLIMWLPADGGPRNLITTKKQVKVPADVKGLKIRTSLTPLDLAKISAWGGIPVPIAWADAPAAMQQGTVDGIDLPWNYHTFVGAEITKYVVVNGSQYGNMLTFTRPDVWSKLPADLQQVIEDVSHEAEEFYMTLNVASREDYRKKVVDAGNVVYYPTAAELELWKTSTDSVYRDKDVLKYTPATLVERIRAAAKVEQK